MQYPLAGKNSAKLSCIEDLLVHTTFSLRPKIMTQTLEQCGATWFHRAPSNEMKRVRQTRETFFWREQNPCLLCELHSDCGSASAARLWKLVFTLHGEWGGKNRNTGEVFETVIYVTRGVTPGDGSSLWNWYLRYTGSYTGRREKLLKLVFTLHGELHRETGDVFKTGTYVTRGVRREKPGDVRTADEREFLFACVSSGWTLGCIQASRRNNAEYATPSSSGNRGGGVTLQMKK